MGLLKQVLLIACMVEASRCSTEPIRPTRTLGSLFGSKPVPQTNQPDPKAQQQTRPLVYQVKYYDKQTHHPENIHPDARNYGTIDKSGVLDPVHQNQLLYNPTIIPQRYYYNPLIPEQPQVYYTIGQVGNSQVLIPCTDNIQDSTIALNVDQPQQKPPAQPQKQPIRPIPQTTVQQPLVREQVVQAASDLQLQGSIPGSGVVGSGLNSLPYAYYYYYYIPENTRNQQVPPQVVPQVVPQVLPQPPQVNPYSNPQYYRVNNPYAYNQYQYQQYPQYPHNQNLPYVPVIVSGVPVVNQGGLNPHVYPQVPQVFQNNVLVKDRNVGQGTQNKPLVKNENQ
ncbi:unnamed protein product [Orchesella dallaii]|uniref:Uncharacterized protein n=1 Tax=Orchesella dallaii TaxID=48710 RepID=A0ABP1QA23_9HEXA